MPHAPRKDVGTPRKPGNYDPHSPQKPLKEQQKSSISPHTRKDESNKYKAKKESERHLISSDRSPSRLSTFAFLPPCQGSMCAASNTGGEVSEGFVVSPPPRYIHQAFDSEAKETKGKDLWKNHTGWDISVVCRGGSWLVHREFIETEAPGFYDFVMGKAKTTQEDGKGILSVDLSAWHPASIGGLLMFLYTGDWPDMDGHPPGPTNLRSIWYHVDLAAQAWALNFPTSVREAAVFKINCATYEFHNSIVGVLSDYPLVPEGYAGVEWPLYLSLEFLYQQDNLEVIEYLMPIRAAVGRLVAIAVPWLLKQPRFMKQFQTLWSQEPMYGRYIGDHHIFSRLGCLLPSWNDPPVDWEPEEGSSFAGDGVIEEDLDEE